MEVDILDLLYKSPTIHTMDGDNDNEDDSMNASPIIILHCLNAVLPIAQDPSWSPKLVHIMGDAKDDPIKRQLFMHQLTNPLLEYLDWYWQREPAVTSLDDSVAWACTCNELWAQLCPLPQHQEQDHHDPQQTNASLSTVSWLSSSTTNPQQLQQQRCRLCLTLLTWIQHMLFLLQAAGATSSTTPATTMTMTNNYYNYPSSLNDLSLALGCYRTLSKDRSESPPNMERD